MVFYSIDVGYVRLEIMRIESIDDTRLWWRLSYPVRTTVHSDNDVDKCICVRGKGQLSTTKAPKKGNDRRVSTALKECKMQ
jgi:hypothetical protein